MAIVQRGSVLVSGIPTVSGGFGSGAALSADGAVLAVGAESENLGKGAVYIYDLVGDVWTLRGSRLTAADGAQYDYFGGKVALSGNGLVLAVGATGWEGAADGQGGVYVFDYTAGAWVQRGAVLTASDAAASDGFGAVALSADGLMLAVGATGWEGATANQGSVYIFDYTAGAWVQRGAVLTASDAATDDYFGNSVALSADGLVLAVGAGGWEGAADGQGGVYIFDYTAGAWVQRGAVLTASDAAASDGFGAAVALSGDGLVLAASAIKWTLNSFTGRVYLFAHTTSWSESTNFSGDDSVADDRFGTGIAMSASGAVLVVGAKGWEGATANQGGVYTYESSGDIARAPTTLTMSSPSGAVSAPTALTVTATGSASAPSLLAMVAPAPAIPAVPGVPGVVWSARCLIDGVDMSARLVGQASVTAAEGAARIASITLRPASGIVAPLDYVGKTITLDYVLVIGTTAVPRRIFTGRVDTPAYDPDSTLLTLTCTDDLQNVIAALPRSAVSHLVGGRFTEAVQGELDDEWDYAQARLTTVAGSLDASASGGLRTTLWDSGSTWATFTESELIYRRMQLTLPQRSTLVNKVEISFDYRFMRLHQRQTTVGWSGTLPEMAKNGYQYPTQQDILGAAEGTGWTVTQGVLYPAPAAIAVEIPVGSSTISGFFYPPAGSIDMAVLHLGRRHSQTVTERYTITVTAHESVAINGELPSALRGALASDFSGSAWESALDVVPLMLEGGVQEYAPDASRDDADYAIQTLLDQARVKILSSHRSGRVGNAILCNPDLDLDKRVAIDTAQVSAAGKVAQLVHVLDFESGSATTEFSLAISGVGGDGSSTPDVLAPPPPRMFVDHSLDWVYEIPPLSCHTYGVTAYDEGLMGLLLNPTEGILVEDIPYYGSINAANPFYVAGSYPVTGFRMQMPGVDDADRNPIDDPVAASYSITVPTDTLTFTVP